jgi:hypothetical protein
MLIPSSSQVASASAAAVLTSQTRNLTGSD